MANDNKDQELLQIFIEEANDLLVSLSGTLRQWENNIEDLSKTDDLKRDLHTLKGSARMVGQLPIGTLAHELETLCESVSKNEIKMTREIFELLSLSVDRIVLMVEKLQKNEVLPRFDDISLKFQSVSGEALSVPNDLKGEGSFKTEFKTELPQMEAVESKAPVHTELIRIRATLLEKLNNLSTENSLIRVGIEQQIGSFGLYLSEMKQDIKRLEVQLNNLCSEIQTYESNMPINISKSNNYQTKLEHEHYRTLDQMSQVVRETSYDLIGILKNLLDTHVVMEAMVINQGRISTELQHRLSDTRLAPFESIVPRLARIARQVSVELNKQIDFKVMRSEGEMDRTILERLIPSLEHILRNAIDHGVEPKEVRVKQGKSEIGRIEVSFFRVGSNAAIEVRDDGAGIDSEVVRAKAVKLGLLAQDANISREEILRYILEPGFSTKEAVTQISGRGVGMDVVNTAVKELGGSLSIFSEAGKGTKITARFPFTASLNRILLFTIKDQIYGMLLTNIESVVRESAETLVNLITDKQSIYESAGKSYHLQYVGALIESERSEVKIAQKKSYPIILFSDSEYPLALVIDSVLYSRELVVQSLGSQFKLTNECSGATMLGDGRVVLILDPYNLSMKAKSIMERGKIEIEFDQDETSLKSGKTLIMVVDDSISVRTVTKRLLERYNYQVITAKDGLDAIQKLQNNLPNLILMDLDMPRMDGFEFAANVRANDKYQNIPIVVVSSREGLMQQDKTEKLKLSAFVKKPFQESELMSTVQQILEKDS